MVKYFPKGIYLQVDFPSINFLNGNFPNVQYPKGQVRPSKAPQAAIGAECCGQDGIEVLAPQLEQARGRALWLGQTWENVFGKLPNILKITWTVPSNDYITVLYCTVQVSADPRAQNLRQGIVMKTSFGTRVSQMGLPSFVDIDIFDLKYYFI